MAIKSIQATNLAKVQNTRRDEEDAETQGSAGQSLTLMQAEKMLKALVDEGWFEKSQKGFFSLAPRALMELRGWLLETYNDEEGEGEVRIKQCYACKEILTTVGRFPFLKSFATADQDRLRVNDVRTETAFVDCMTSVLSDFSPRKRPENVQSARKIGQARILLASEPQSI